MEVTHAVTDVLITAFVFFSLKYFWNQYRTKNVFIIEDNPVEHILMRTALDMKNTRLIICPDYDSFVVQRLLRKPDAVVIDYRLPKLTGDKIFKLCRSQCIPAVIMTADVQPIFGIDENNIIRKTGNYVEQIKEFLNKVLYDNSFDSRF